MNAIQERIKKAMETTLQVVPGYLENTLDQRAEKSGKAAGSIYEGMTRVELQLALLTAKWESYSHPAVMQGCEAFKASIPGRLGIVSLTDLPSNTVVTLDDRKNTGKVSAVVRGVRGPKVDFTVLILGQEQGQEVIFTFHPGDPVRPSSVEATPGLHGKQITAAEAIGMGLEMAKVE